MLESCITCTGKAPAGDGPAGRFATWVGQLNSPARIPGGERGPLVVKVSAGPA